MADDQYAQREAAYNDNVGLVMGKFATAMVHTAGQADDAYIDRLVRVAELPNYEADASLSIIGEENPLALAINAPMLMIANIEPFNLTKATMDMSLDVSATQSVETKVDSKSKVEASAGGGGFGFHASVAMSAEVGVAHDRKRSSDYRSHMSAHLEMGVRDTPEGVHMIRDVLTEFYGKGMEINKMAMDAKLAEKKASMEALIDKGEVPELPAAEGEAESKPSDE